ncbi:hypothetical protein ABZQ74_31790 [Pseudomonas aeruginosa]|mgnify:CR=1 FL=1|nr:MULTISPECIES: hypothetical protein [Pseudomonas]EIU2545777.1 hypothetical protein [Pseudomonas aeruginosa]EIU2890507.1 hypothetical protein [Pseudomonas aeruginosa]EIU3160206.1 hypothetical protein [Pseudomonas aeruginosa]EIU3733480.1 hypothetical protein [Pseudomonas aeruginosa]EIU4342122.1 hypothetical protein [Pseudomonas aeruginosa]
MKRRTLMAGMLLASGAVAGHLATKRLYGSASTVQSPADFAAAMSGVRLQYVSQELLLKLYTQTVADQDRQQIVREVVNHNRNLFVANAYERHHGQPGFYRVTE